MSGAPTYDLVALITPENEFGENGNGADGIMFDIMGIKSVDMYSIELLQLVSGSQFEYDRLFSPKGFA